MHMYVVGYYKSIQVDNNNTYACASVGSLGTYSTHLVAYVLLGIYLILHIMADTCLVFLKKDICP